MRMSESFYPSVNSLLNLDRIPDSLSFVKDALNNAGNALYYKNLQLSVDSSQGYYEMDLIPGNQNAFEIDLFGTGLMLIINPDDTGNTSIHISLSYSWPVLALIKGFSTDGFSYAGQQLLDLFKSAVYIPDNQSLSVAVKVFEGGETFTAVSALVDKVNVFYSLSGTDTIPYPVQGSYQDMINELLTNIEAANITDSFGDTVAVQNIIGDLYLNISQPNFLDNLKVNRFKLQNKSYLGRLVNILSLSLLQN